uniref:Protein LTV1 homolog n=1 Tax=Scapholeberis mucronata TaxID=202097 RepID=A0A4Y7NKD4_9CRUS|nr:EOG090X08PQ [Scapholeberis mucronata]SVE93708.1 EOG090X08PQ [Scapholeberis mucronata]
MKTTKSCWLSYLTIISICHVTAISKVNTLYGKHLRVFAVERKKGSYNLLDGSLVSLWEISYLRISNSTLFLNEQFQGGVVCYKKSTLRLGQHFYSNRLIVRFASGAWCVGCFFIVQFYSTTLISHLMSPYQKLIANSMHKIANTPGVSLMSDKGFALDLLLKSIQFGDYKKLGDRFQEYPDLCNKTDDCLKRMRENGNIAFGAPVQNLKLIMKGDLQASGFCHYYQLKETAWKVNVFTLLQKNSPYTDPISMIRVQYNTIYTQQAVPYSAKSDQVIHNLNCEHTQYTALQIKYLLNMPKTKKFIDKKNAVTFNLVHRSQKDPLAADEKAPQRVLVPITLRPERNEETPLSSKQKATSNQKEELAKLGIFYDDDYDYMQHLRDVTKTAEWVLAEDSKNTRVWKAPVAKGISEHRKLKLPSSVFQSEVEEEIGLLNRAAPHSGPRPDLDPDIVAALDDDFDFDDPENELEDDFITAANQIPDEDDESGEDDEEDDVLGDMRSDSDRLSPDFDDDKKSRFTEYSMTSSVIRRNAQLSLLDDRFEQLMAQYDDDEMGALDCEEIEGHISIQDSQVLKLADEFEKDKTEGIRLGQKIGKIARDEVEGAVERYLENYESGEESDSSSTESGEPERKWDCESILSTYSNIYNHPQLISEPRKLKIKVCPRTGVPLDVLGKPGLTKKFLDQLNEATETKKDCLDTQSVISTLSTISIRPKDETPEQRKERKLLVKEYRKERRKEKKANSLAFKEEKKLQEKQNINNRVNVHGLKML